MQKPQTNLNLSPAGEVTKALFGRAERQHHARQTRITSIIGTRWARITSIIGRAFLHSRLALYSPKSTQKVVPPVYTCFPRRARGNAAETRPNLAKFGGAQPPTPPKLLAEQVLSFERKTPGESFRDNGFMHLCSATVRFVDVCLWTVRAPEVESKGQGSSN